MLWIFENRKVNYGEEIQIDKRNKKDVALDLFTKVQVSSCRDVIFQINCFLFHVNCEN